MVDQLPQLAHHIETDVLPILVTLDRVGPDVHQLLEVLQDVRLAIQGVPGFPDAAPPGRARRGRTTSRPAP